MKRAIMCSVIAACSLAQAQDLQFDLTGTAWEHQGSGYVSAGPFDVSFLLMPDFSISAVQARLNGQIVGNAAGFAPHQSVLFSNYKGYVGNGSSLFWEDLSSSDMLVNVGAWPEVSTIGPDSNFALDVTGATVTSVPEPSTWALLLLGLGAVIFLAKRRAMA